MLATFMPMATSAVMALSRLDPEGQACLDARAARPLWWAILQDTVTMTDGAFACSDSIATKVGEAIWDSQFQPAIDDMKNGVADTTKTMATFWIKVPDPDVTDPTGRASDVIAFLWHALAPLVGIVMILSVIAGCAALMYSQRGGELRKIGIMLLRYILYSGMIVTVVSSAMVMTHESAQWLIEKSTLGTNFADNIANLFNNTANITSGILYFLLLLTGAGVACALVVMMVFRGGIILIRVGVILLSVAVSNTEWGEEGLKTSVHSLGAWIAYPFVAAIVYSAGFRLMGTNPDIGQNGMLQCLYGVGIMLMVIFALPATMRLVHPAMAAAAGGKGAGAAIAGAATTFIVMKSGRSGR